MDLVFELANVLAETLLALYYLQRVYNACTYHYQSIFAFFIYTVGLALLSIIPLSAFIRIAYSMISMLCLCICVYRSKILNAVYASLAFNVVVILADVFCIIILSSFGYDIKSLDLGGSGRTISIVVAKLIVLIGIQLLTHLIHRNNAVFPQWTIPLIIGQGISILIALLALHITLQNQNNDLFVIVLGIGLLYLNLILCFYGEAMKMYYENKYRSELAEQQLQLQIDYYKKEDKEKNATRALWHDIHKYLFSMYDLLKSGDSSEAMACIKQAETVIENIHKTVDVGNVVINGILDRAMEQIQGTNINLLLDVWIPAQLDIAAVDAYIILGNTIDNAVDACLALKNVKCPTISLKLKQQGRILYYEITNPFQQGLSQKKSGYHGYGLLNVRKCIEKYNGTIDITTCDQIFRVQIQLPL